MSFGLSAAGLVLAFSIIGTAESLHISSQPLGVRPPLCERYHGCDKIMFDEATQKWKEPRPELQTDGRHAEVQNGARREYLAWQNRHDRDLSMLKKAAENSTVAENTVVLLGDSISEAWERPFFSRGKAITRENRHYPSGPNPNGDSLASGIVPFAIGGDRIQDLAYRLFEGGGMDALKKFAPKTVFLMVGTNDFGMEENVEVAKKELEILVKQLQAVLPSDTHLVLQPPLPRGRQPCRTGNKADRGTGRGCDENKEYVKHWDAARNPAYTYFNQLTAVLKSAADGVQTTSFLDCSDAFLKNGADLDLEVSFEKDMVHLTNAGYSKLASCIEQGTGIRMHYWKAM